MLTCRELIEFLDTYLNGEISPERSALFEEHLAVCPSCVEYIKTYQETIRVSREAFAGADNAVPDEVPPELIRAILAARDR